MATLYPVAMVRILMIIATVLSLSAVLFTAQAHEAGMIGGAGYSAHSQHVEDISSSKASCGGEENYQADIGLCDFICAGVSVLPSLERIALNEATRRGKYLRSPDETLPSTIPGSNYRPPILRLL